MAVTGAMVFSSFTGVFAAEITNAEVQVNGATLEGVSAIYDGESVYIAEADAAAVFGDAEGLTAVTVEGAEGNYIELEQAGEAKGLKTGWDSIAETAIVVDFAKLKEGLGEFTILQEVMNYGNSYNDGYAFSGTINLEFGTTLATSDGSELKVTGTGDIKGITKDMKMDMALAMNINLDDLVEKLGGIIETEEDRQVVDALKSFSVDYIIDMQEGVYYMNIPFLAQFSPVSADTWYKLDLKKVYEEMGMDYADIVSTVTGADADIKDLFMSSFDLVELTSVTDYQEAVAAVEIFNTILSDDAFTKTATGYSYSNSLGESGVKCDITADIAAGADNKVTGYSLGIDFDMDGIVMEMDTSMEGNRGDYSVKFNIEDALSMVISGDMVYTETTEEPRTAPTGNVVDLFEGMGGSVPATPITPAVPDTQEVDSAPAPDSSEPAAPNGSYNVDNARNEYLQG